MSISNLSPGFLDPARESQRVFRVLMEAMAQPGKRLRLKARLAPPAPLTPELAALALTLLDFETAVWLDPPLAAEPAVAAFLRFHTSVRVVDAPESAQFALISDFSSVLPFAQFAQGEADYPDRSATLLIAVAGFEDGPLVLEGPGLAAPRRIGARPLPADFAAQMARNAEKFPLGIDLVLAGPGEFLAIPRSVRVRVEV